MISMVDKVQVPWPTGTAFDTIGWSPDGDVRGAYACSTTFLSNRGVVCVGAIDPDDDGIGTGAGALHDSVSFGTLYPDERENSILDILIPAAHAGTYGTLTLTNLDTATTDEYTLMKMVHKTLLVNGSMSSLIEADMSSSVASEESAVPLEEKDVSLELELEGTTAETKSLE